MGRSIHIVLPVKIKNKIKKKYIYRITADLKVETDINTASQKERAVILQG